MVSYNNHKYFVPFVVKNIKLRSILNILLFLLLLSCQNSKQFNLEELFRNPPESAKPWVYWYWMHASVSEEGITADLEAMKENGIGGAYLFFILGPADPPLFTPVIEQLTPEWWKMVNYAFSEAKRLGIQLAIHSCDGFTVAGGPWITPDKSMQKGVWSELFISGNQTFKGALPKPEIVEHYYKDLAVFAYPTPLDSKYHTDRIVPVVTTNITNEDIGYLSKPTNSIVFKSVEPCWIQYEFEEPFTCYTLHIRTKGYNMASHHLIIESSNDGVNFTRVCRLDPPRHGWQDYEADITHSIPRTTAKYFRFL